MSKALLGLAAIFAHAGTAFGATYDCTIENPVAIHRDGAAASIKSIRVGGVDGEQWKFRVEGVDPKSTEQRPEAVITWPSNPIQIAGKFPYLPTSDGSVAILALSGGPCLFTEYACMSIVQIVDQSEKVAKISILPSAIALDEKNGRSPYLVVMEGECVKGAAQ